MCGIVGIAIKAKNGFIKKEEDIFWQMLYANQLRGEDSTGVICVENNKDFYVIKDASPASWVLDAFKKEQGPKNIIAFGKALIGHNRKATVGKVTDDTAHPFVVGDTFSMVHNGTLFNHRQLANTDVDSEALAQVLAPVLDVEEFDKQKFEEVIGKVNGAYAVAAYSQKANKIYLFRNKERPLWLIEQSTHWSWASEGMMLGWILARNNDYSTKPILSESVKEDCLYTINLATNTLTKEDYVPKKAMPHQPWTGGRNKWSNGRCINEEENKTEDVKESSVAVITKNAFKRFRNKMINTVTIFFVDDWMEKYFPRRVEQGETALLVSGESSDSFPVDHIVRGTYTLPEVMSRDSVEEYTTRSLFSGRITDMHLNAENSCITVFVDDIKQVPKSSSKVVSNEETTPINTLH